MSLYFLLMLMAGVQERGDIDTRPFILLGNPVAIRKDDQTIEQDAGRVAVLASATLMSIKEFTLPTTGTADGGNTGDGTVTVVAKLADGKSLIVGAYNLEVTGAGVDGRAAGAITPGTNTGNGTVTLLAVVAGEFPKVGDWVLTCTDANIGGTTTGAGVFTGTGNGTIGAITPGTEVIEGAYIATCIDATVSGSEIFEVIDPNGVKLEDLTVGIAYLNDHFGVTITDGLTDFIVGDYWTITMTIEHGGLFTLTDPNGVDVKEDIVLPGTPVGTVAVESGGISFTITDGGTDFIVGDDFTMAIAAAEGGVWKLEDPNGNTIATGLTMGGVPLGATVFNEGGITFTITDGATDFIVGDKFSITVTVNGKWVPYDPAGLLGEGVPKGIYDPESTLGDITAAALVAGDIVDMPILISGARFDRDKLVFENSGAYTDIILGTSLTLEDHLRTFGLVAENTIAGSVAENV